MRVETRQPAAGDVHAALDAGLGPGQLRRDGDELRIGPFDLPYGHGLPAAARSARSLRRRGGTIAWAAADEAAVRSLVEGTAYGSYDAGLYKAGIRVDSHGRDWIASRGMGIVRASNGKTIDVLNTDAERRLVLADVLHHARESGATHVVDHQGATGYGVRLLVELAASFA